MITNGLMAVILVGMTLSEPLSFAAEPSKPFWLIGYAFAILFAFAHPADVLACARKNYLILLWPALACLSAIWAPDPGVTLYNGFQLLMTTLIGFTLVLSFGPRRTIRVLFWAFSLAVWGSLLYYVVSPGAAIGWTNEFRGFYHTKNELGDYAALLALCSVALYLGEAAKLRYLVSFVVGLAVLAGLTRSGTATVAVALTLTFVPLLVIYMKRRSWLPITVALMLIAATATIAYMALEQIDVFGYALGSIGKDATLTGRTVLWGFALDGFAQKPFLGFGYKGWWDPSNPNVFFLRYVIGQDLWYFHNVGLEIAVSFGSVGVALLVITLLASYRRVVIDFLRRPSASSIWNLLFLINVTIYSTAENALFVNHGMLHLLLCALFALSARNAGVRFSSKSGHHLGRRAAFGSQLLAYRLS